MTHASGRCSRKKSVTSKTQSIERFSVYYNSQPVVRTYRSALTTLYAITQFCNNHECCTDMHGTGCHSLPKASFALGTISNTKL